MKNLFGKSREINNAYATYQVKNNEDKNQYARWFTACKSPMTYDRWEYGDPYISEIMSVNPKLIDATEEWKKEYA